MPDGNIAICYAEAVAEGVAANAYPLGFEHHYWKPALLDEPGKLNTPSKIFLDSMSDLFGVWVRDEQINRVVEVATDAHWHTFQSLTKNTPRLLQFEYPRNWWVGASTPPDFMFGGELKPVQQKRMLARTLQILRELKLSGRAAITWLSAEPLSWDIADVLAAFPGAIDWCVIGAASNGRQKFPPNPQDFKNTLAELDHQGVAVFYKGNLQSLPAARFAWREDFPIQRRLFE